jgi:hypothetical protein
MDGDIHTRGGVSKETDSDSFALSLDPPANG